FARAAGKPSALSCSLRIRNMMGLTVKRFCVVDANRYPYILSLMFSISMDEMRKWLINYERVRHSKQPNESWISSKYDIQGMHWQELQQIFLPNLNMNFGQAVSALKKSWKAYKIAGRSGEPRGDLAYRIVRIQDALGIEKSTFPELQGSSYGEEWSKEDEQLRREEQQELIEKLRNEEW